MIMSPFEAPEHNKTRKNQSNFRCVENYEPEKGCVLLQWWTPQLEGRLNLFEIQVLNRTKTVFTDFTYIWLLFYKKLF